MIDIKRDMAKEEREREREREKIIEQFSYFIIFIFTG